MILSMDPVELDENTDSTEMLEEETRPKNDNLAFSAILPAALDLLATDTALHTRPVLVFLRQVIERMIWTQNDPAPLCLLLSTAPDPVFDVNIQNLINCILPDHLKKVLSSPTKKRKSSTAGSEFSRYLLQSMLAGSKVDLVKEKLLEKLMSESCETEQKFMVQQLVFCLHQNIAVYQQNSSTTDSNIISVFEILQEIFDQSIDKLDSLESLQENNLSLFNISVDDIDLSQMKSSGMKEFIINSVVQSPVVQKYFLWKPGFGEAHNYKKLSICLTKNVSNFLKNVCALMKEDDRQKAIVIPTVLIEKVQCLLQESHDVVKKVKETIVAVGTACFMFLSREDLVRLYEHCVEFPAKYLAADGELTPCSRLMINILEKLYDRKVAYYKTDLSSQAINKTVMICCKLQQFCRVVTKLFENHLVFCSSVRPPDFTDVLQNFEHNSEASNLISLICLHNKGCLDVFEKQCKKFKQLPQLHSTAKDQILKAKLDKQAASVVPTPLEANVLRPMKEEYPALYAHVKDHLEGSDQLSDSELDHVFTTFEKAVQKSYDGSLLTIVRHTIEHIYKTMGENVCDDSDSAKINVQLTSNKDQKNENPMDCTTSETGSDDEEDEMSVDESSDDSSSSEAVSQKQNQEKTRANISKTSVQPGLRKHLKRLYTCFVDHTEFSTVLLEKESENNKEALVQTLLCVAKLETSGCHVSHLPVLLGAYNASLSLTDQTILQLLQIYDACGCSMENLKPFAWGEKARELMSLKETLQTSLSKDLPLDHLLELCTAPRMHHACLNLPLYRQMGEVQSWQCLQSEESCLDPCYLLFVFNHVLGPENIVRSRKFIDQNCLSYLVCCLSCHDSHLRALAKCAIDSFIPHLEGSKFRERAQVLAIIECLKNSIEEPNTRLPFIITLFVAKAIRLASNYTDHMFQHVQNFILLKSYMDVRNVPEFEKFFFSSSMEFKIERSWILKLMREGLREFKDYMTLERKDLFHIIQTFYTSPASDYYSQDQILLLVKGACSNQEIALHLVTNTDIIPWLQLILPTCMSSSEKQTTFLVAVKGLWNSLSKEVNRRVTKKLVLQPSTLAACMALKILMVEILLHMKDEFSVSQQNYQNILEIMVLAAQTLQSIEDYTSSKQHAGFDASHIAILLQQWCRLYLPTSHSLPSILHQRQATTVADNSSGECKQDHAKNQFNSIFIEKDLLADDDILKDAEQIVCLINLLHCESTASAGLYLHLILVHWQVQILMLQIMRRQNLSTLQFVNSCLSKAEKFQQGFQGKIKSDKAHLLNDDVSFIFQSMTDIITHCQFFTC